MELTKRLLNDPTPAVKTFVGLHAVPGETWQRQCSPDPKRPGRIRGASEIPPRGRSANASLHPFVEPTPVGHAVTPPEHAQQIFPRDCSPEHEQNPGKGCSVTDARPTSHQRRSVYRKMSFDKGQEVLGQQRFGLGISPAKNTLAILTLPVAIDSTQPGAVNHSFGSAWASFSLMTIAPLMR